MCCMYEFLQLIIFNFNRSPCSASVIQSVSLISKVTPLVQARLEAPGNSVIAICDLSYIDHTASNLHRVMSASVSDGSIKGWCKDLLFSGQGVWAVQLSDFSLLCVVCSRVWPSSAQWGVKPSCNAACCALFSLLHVLCSFTLVYTKKWHYCSSSGLKSFFNAVIHFTGYFPENQILILPFFQLCLLF